METTEARLTLSVLPKKPIPITYRFGPYLLDTGSRLLCGGGSARPLREKLFQVLSLLLEANGQMVTKDTFFSRIWPDESATDANLTTHVFMLRRILGERSHQQPFIVTVSGQGYRFARPVETKVGLGMKGSCEGCSTALPGDVPAMICSYECTFCLDCATANGGRCPNCAGELVMRPRRAGAAGAR